MLCRSRNATDIFLTVINIVGKAQYDGCIAYTFDCDVSKPRRTGYISCSNNKCNNNNINNARSPVFVVSARHPNRKCLHRPSAGEQRLPWRGSDQRVCHCCQDSRSLQWEKIQIHTRHTHNTQPLRCHSIRV